MSQFQGLISVTGLLAQTSPRAGGSNYLGLISILFIFVIFYFLLIRPQQKRQKQHHKMIESVTKGDRVLTSGGMYGVVIGVDNDKVVLRIAENVKAEFAKSAIAHIVGKE